ncbi:MAG: leucine-rich repeat domain-containing protein [Clostridia bacterium]|nr:leucine-rich repeat domain-containing protein [Clostridia bacterium]
MKRIVSFILVLLLTLPLSSCFHDGWDIQKKNDPESTAGSITESYERDVTLPGDIVLTLSDDGSYYSVTDGKNYTASEIVIPASHNGVPIKRIASVAFKDNSAIKTVTLPDSIEKIERWAFEDCVNIEYNEYGGAYYLGNAENPYAFLISSTKADIGAVDINENVRLIADYAFFQNNSLMSVTLPDSLVFVGECAFCDCANLKQVDFGEGVQRLGVQAFSDTAVDSVILPDSVIDIGERAFRIMIPIKELDLGESIERIGSNAFRDVHIDVLELPDSLLELGGGNFSGSTFRKLVIGDNLKKIFAFSGCSLLTEIVFGDSVEYIDSGAFKNCDSLIEVKMPKSLMAISTQAFDDCDKLKFNYFKGARYLGSADSDYEVLLRTPEKYDGDLFLHPDTRLIAEPSYDRDYNQLQNTETVTMDGNGKYLRVEGNCVIDKASKTLVFGAAQSSIPNDGSILYIADDAFYYRKIKEVTVPEGVIGIGDRAFYSTELVSVKFNRDLKTIGEEAFAYVINLSELNLPEGLESIGKQAFNGSNDIKDIYIPGSVREIGWGAFQHCFEATTITIGEGATKLGPYVFDGCDKVYKVVLPSTLKEIDDGAFRQLNSLTSIALPEGLLYIGDNAFELCQNLWNIDMPKSLVSIGDSAFNCCKKLLEANLNIGLIYIGNNAFQNTNVKVKYAGTVEMWKKIENSHNLIRGKEDMKVICADGEIILNPDPALKESMFD